MKCKINKELGGILISANIFTAGPARALFFSGDQLIGIGKTLSDTTFNTSITAEEVRGGPGNLLYGQYFHDSSLTVSITDVNCIA